MNELLLDTDTISFFLRNQPKVMAHAGNYLKFHKGFTFSIITHFEILRGLKGKKCSKTNNRLWTHLPAKQRNKSNE